MADRQTINYAVYIRVIGTVLILLCHLTQQNVNPYIQKMSQFFNIGVPIFFILSGFLFGINPKGIKEWKGWYVRRIKRIYIPYEIFIVILAVIYFLQGLNVFTKDWLLLVIGAQGSNVGVWGAEQTWFISALLLCYLFTPLISWLIVKNEYIKIIMLVTVIGLPVLLSLLKAVWAFTLFTPIVEYLIAFWIGRNIDKINFSLKYVLCAASLLVFSFSIRILAKVICDGSILYDRLIVFYTHMIAAFCLCYIISSLCQNIKVYKVINWFSNISFEIYLFHYMFTVGPVSLFGSTPNWITDCILVMLITLVVSTLARAFANRILYAIKKTKHVHGV